MLYNHQGDRKYVTALEREAFIAAAQMAAPHIQTFCLTLAYTGVRISEALAVTPGLVDFNTGAIRVECLKKRRRGIFRTIPVPTFYLAQLNEVHNLRRSQSDFALRSGRLWKWSRTAAWMKVKTVMHAAGVWGSCATPKALRHGFAVYGAVEAGIPLNVMQRWLGHSRIETTAVYLNVVGPEERSLAEKMWLHNDHAH